MNNENESPDSERIAPEAQSVPFFMPLTPNDIDEEWQTFAPEKDPPSNTKE